MPSRRLRPAAPAAPRPRYEQRSNKVIRGGSPEGVRCCGASINSAAARQVFSRNRTRFRYTSNPQAKVMGSLTPADLRFFFGSNLVLQLQPPGAPFVQLCLRFNSELLKLSVQRAALTCVFVSFSCPAFAQQVPAKAGGPADGFSALKLRQIGPFRGGRVDAVTGVPGQPLVGLLWRNRRGSIQDDQRWPYVGAHHGREDQLWLNRLDRRGCF